MLLLDEVFQADSIGVMRPAADALADAFWPGGLTVVVPQRPGVTCRGALTGGAPIGLRVPDHATPRALAAAVGPLPTTSANVSGLPEARDAAEILDQLGDAIDLILDAGPAHGGPASTVVDCSGERPSSSAKARSRWPGSWPCSMQRGSPTSSLARGRSGEPAGAHGPARPMRGGPRPMAVITVSTEARGASRRPCRSWEDSGRVRRAREGGPHGRKESATP